MTYLDSVKAVSKHTVIAMLQTSEAKSSITFIYIQLAVAAVLLIKK